ncbi:MAG TPA: phosphoribosyl-AMP cyclohydrolase, partial [Asticcacaulis sp.]
MSESHALPNPLTVADIDRIDFAKDGGLVPAVVQHADTLQVLMLGYMNAEALKATLQGGRVTFWSRSRGRLWMKGETSGDTLELDRVLADCDEDALLVYARPNGPTCH